MPQPTERTTIKVQAERAVLAAVRLPGSRHDPADPFGELAALAAQAGATVVGELTQTRDRPVAGTYIGKGKLEELRALCEMTGATTIIFDHDLSPKQIAAIEEATERKVLDRSELILDIFASRATTHAAKLQVELAQLEYTYPRLRAMWSHLERIAGGAPAGIGTRGPGEQQLEIDRRLVQRRKSMLQRELREIESRKQREVDRRKQGAFTVGLVGYTNAGKSTLFNALTEGGAYADNRLFATLMTRTREWDLGGGEIVLLSDTVGFVRDLPHDLIASFKATLEEATRADLLLLVLDVADPAAELHYDTVIRTLDDLDEEAAREHARNDRTYNPPERILLLNKSDKLPDNRELLIWQSRVPHAITISALSTPDHRLQRGHDELVTRIRDAARGPIRELDLLIPLSDSRTISILENRADILDRTYENNTLHLKVRVGQRQLDRLRAAGAAMQIHSDAPKQTDHA